MNPKHLRQTKRHARSTAGELVQIAAELRDRVGGLKFAPPVAFVYNPLDYAWLAHEAYLRKYGASRKQIVFLGMNPGPYGMVQTGVPFGEVHAVRNWMRIEARIGKPRHEHSRRPVEGFACERSEVSGRRLWGLFAERFGSAENFFAAHFVANYCPLAFFDQQCRNLTPDKLPRAQADALVAVCNQHLARLVEILQPDWLIGVGGFAYERAELLFPQAPPKTGRILHPSPASPAANRDWAGQATAQLEALGGWKAGTVKNFGAQPCHGA